MKVKKAVILAAGHGTRVLPATKSVPKEMLTIVDKPAIQYIVEEITSAGIDNVLIILSRGKSVVQDHFDRSPELENALLEKNNRELYDCVVNIAKMSQKANLAYMRQQEAKGTGNALLLAKNFVGGEPFIVAYADDVIIGEDPAAAQICRAYEKHGKGAVAMKEVPLELVMKYSSLKTNNIEGNVYEVSDMIEKPKENEIFSYYSILGRCVLPPKIFEILEKTEPGYGGEVQLTDAMKQLARTDGMLGVDFTGVRYDMGSKLGMLKAIVEVGMSHREIGEDFKKYLKDIVNTI